MPFNSSRIKPEGGARLGWTLKVAKQAVVLGGVAVAMGALTVVVAAAFLYAVATGVLGRRSTEHGTTLE